MHTWWRAIAGFAVASWLLFGWIDAVDAAPRCSIVLSTGITFGIYRDRSPYPLDSAGFVAFRCDEVRATDVVHVQLSRGRGSTFIPRHLRGPSPRFNYNLYLDAARTVVWGDGTAGTSEYRTIPPDGTMITIPVYGRIAPGQSVRPGQYSDQVLVTLLF